MPVYNEAAVVQHVLAEWSEALERLDVCYEIHAYNDGSRDNTLATLEQCAQANQKVVVHNKDNSGHGPTILTGYRDNAGIPWIFQTDSDNELSPNDFAGIWARRNEFDILLGRRVFQNRQSTRRCISWCSRLVVKTFYGKGIHDVRARLDQCGESISFSVICDTDMVAHFRRVTFMAGGVVSDHEETEAGVILEICK